MPTAKPSALHQSVWDAFSAFSEPLEGARIPYMYLDVKRLVTTGTGNLIDPVTAALALPWRVNGRLATQREIREDWTALKSEDDRRAREGERPLYKLHHKYAAAYTRCRLDDADIVELVASKLAANVAYMVGHAFPDFATWPADAQLAACSMAWAVGPGFASKFPNFARAAKAQDWPTAKAACSIRAEGNPGVVPRNTANRLCLDNAAAVAAAGADVSRLWWPSAFAAPFAAAEADTEPAVPHPGPAPTALAGAFSVAEVLTAEALKDMAGGD
jgi:hypothetical protein